MILELSAIQPGRFQCFAVVIDFVPVAHPLNPLRGFQTVHLLKGDQFDFKLPFRSVDDGVLIQIFERELVAVVNWRLSFQVHAKQIKPKDELKNYKL